MSKPRSHQSPTMYRVLVPVLLAIGLMASVPDWVTIAQANGYYQSPETALLQNANLVTTTMINKSLIGMAIGKRTRGDSSKATSGLRIDGLRIGGVQLDGNFFADEDSAAGGRAAGQLGGFVTAVGGFGDVFTELEFSDGGLIGGVDYQFSEALLGGLAINWINTNVTYANGGGGSDKNTYGASLYTGYSDGPLNLDAVFNYSFSDYQMTRSLIASPTNVGGGDARGTNNSDEIILEGGAGYDFEMGGLTLGPEVRASLVKVWMDGYSETGAGIDNTEYSAFTLTSLTTDVGGEASFSFKVAAGRITPRLHAFWVHEFEADSQVLTYRSVGTTPFRTATILNPDRNYGRIGVGATMELQRGLEIYVDYEAIIGFDLLNSNQFSAGGRFEF